MRDDYKKELDRALDERNQRMKETREVEDALWNRRKELQEEFAQVAANAIRPAMEEIGEYLESRGQMFAIEEQQLEISFKAMLVTRHGEHPRQDQAPYCAYQVDYTAENIKTVFYYRPDQPRLTSNEQHLQVSDINREQVRARLVQFVKEAAEKT